MLWSDTLTGPTDGDLKTDRLEWRGSYTDKGDKTLFKEPEIRGLQRGPLDVGKLKKLCVCVCVCVCGRARARARMGTMVGRPGDCPLTFLTHLTPHSGRLGC